MRVCIDPGHGGIDPGAVSKDGVLEKTINLYVAERLAEYLRRAGVEAFLTRQGDDGISLSERCTVANVGEAEFFVSIHANAATTEEAVGYEIFHWPTSIKGKELAVNIAKYYGVASDMPLRRVSGNDLHVLRCTGMPAVLVELGFLTNKGDLALLKEPAFQDKIALGIAFGILDMRA